MITPTISNLLSLAAGAVVASGVAGAILLARDQPEPEPGKVLSERSRRGASMSPKDPGEDENLMARFQRVGSTSHSLFNRLELENQLDEIPFDEIGDFIAESKGQLTRVQRAQAYTRLLVRWAREDPAGAMNCLLEHNVESLVQPLDVPLSLTGQICQLWMAREGEQFQSWLINSWGEGMLTRNPLQDSVGERSTYQKIMGDYLLETLQSEQGFEAALKVMKKFPSDAYPSLMSSIGGVVGPFGGFIPKERIVPMYEVYRTIPPGLGRVEAGALIWKSWLKADPQGAEEAMTNLSPPDELEARLAVIPGPGGYAVKEKSEAQFEVGDQVYKPDSLLEEVAIETALQQGLSTADAVALIARQRLATEAANDGHMMGWLGRLPSSVDIDQALIEAGNRIIPDSEIQNPKDDYRGVITLASYIRDFQVRQKVGYQAYRELLKYYPSEADDLLRFNHFSASFRAELKEIRDQKGQ